MRPLLAALTAAVAVSALLAAGQAAASPARPAGVAATATVPGGRPHPMPVARRPMIREPAAAGAQHRKPIRVGTVTIPPCAASALAWCTRIAVPLDYRDPSAGKIKIGFWWYPARRGHPVGTILATEGGPGFPTTGSADSYLGTFGPLLARRNLLLVNLRGTGNSSAFLCKALQNWRAAYGIAAYTVDTGKCGRQLNRTRRPGGGFVAASSRYTTAFAARDVALVLHRLRTGKVDFYGDSYGTFFGHTFTARYASLLRSVTGLLPASRGTISRRRIASKSWISANR
jgi:hypothetical protein